MTIVLNENEWAEEMIKSRALGKRPLETMRRVARYYLDKGASRKDVRRTLDAFLLQCEPTASLPKWSDALDKAASLAAKYEAINIESVNITKPEMERIEKLGGKQTQRLAFTLLCLARYWIAVNPDFDGWVNQKDSDIMRMANINTSIKRQSQMYHSLIEEGLISMSRKVDCTSVRVCFIEEGETVMRVTDFRNLGNQYMMYHGAPYFVCANCGITTKIDKPNVGRRQKYCRSCAVQIDLQNKVNFIMRSRKTPA